MYRHRMASVILLTVAAVAVMTFVANGPRRTFADDPTPTPIVTSTLAATPYGSMTPAVTQGTPEPTVYDLDETFWASTTTPQPITVTVPPFFWTATPTATP
jgi:hypothetical protein